MGRPSLYKPEYARQAEKLCNFGATDAELGDFFGVSRNTILAWKNEHSEFGKAMAAGKDSFDSRVVDALFARATGYTDPDGKHYPPDTTAMIFWLKNRIPAQWRDKVDHEHKGNVTYVVNTGTEDRPPVGILSVERDDIRSRSH
jgi:hypothetical protein